MSSQKYLLELISSSNDLSVLLSNFDYDIFGHNEIIDKKLFLEAFIYKARNFINDDPSLLILYEDDIIYLSSIFNQFRIVENLSKILNENLN
jgi:hypothetical protein